MDTDQPTADSQDTSGDESVCVVATRPDTFERCRDGFYPCPQSYPRTERSFDYMAFYRTAPVSSITHYARVSDRVRQTRDSPGPMEDTDWTALIDSTEDDITVFVLADLVSLESPVANDGNGVRGAWYCTVSDLRTADTLSALADQT